MKLRIFLLLIIFIISKASHLSASELVSNLPEGEGRDLVIENCTACHTASIIKQNRMNRKEWNETIDWMQKNQGMWELETAERNIILNYLAGHLGKKESSLGSEGNQRSNPMYEFQYLPNPL